jgi:hypothetical protein
MKKLFLTLLMGVALTTAFGQKAKDNTLTKKEKADNWKLLFDGTTATRLGKRRRNTAVTAAAGCMGSCRWRSDP